ncbi:beta-lactamase family protein [Chloroflexia bacterium SDU3-3]|nr:beta-lactamase family protein [Chloroflexia bacterium SDU3-3]
MTLHATIASTIRQAIERHIFPGAVVLLARDGHVAHHAAYGTTCYGDPGSRPIAPDDIFDIASLTKMFTATAALRLIEAGALALDAPLADVLPGYPQLAITIWHLLTHTSGIDIRLSALRELPPEQIRQAIYRTQPQRAPGEAVAYSNVNTLLLGDLVAHLTSQPLDHAIARLVLQPLGLRETMFRPPAALRPRIVPTEVDADWRGGLVHGHVHDESAYALGGVAGHAGLFSTARDLLGFCQAWLLAAEGQPGGILGSTIAQQATTSQTPQHALACGLGWMMDRPNFMGAALHGSFGHTGFTGTAMVVVPQQRAVVIMLTNRVYPRRTPAQHHEVCAALVDLALGS